MWLTCLLSDIFGKSYSRLSRLARRSDPKDEIVVDDSEKPDFRSAMKRLKERNLGVNTVIDVGASSGCWSRQAMNYFPDASYLLVEANMVHKKSLDEFCRNHTNAFSVLKVAGDSDSLLYFDGADPYGGLASHVPIGSNCTQIPSTTIDIEVANRSLSGPFMLKLDTHGFEVPIICGAAETLKSTEALIVECYNYSRKPRRLLFYEMCQFLDSYGFRPIDIYDILYRPKDKAFWQCDVVFIKKERDEFICNSYK